MNITPQQGDYFEVNKLTESQFNDIVKVYEPFVDLISNYHDFGGYVGWDPSGHFMIYVDDLLFKKNSRLLTYEDVFGKIDQDNPEWTEEDFANARTGSEIFAELGIGAPKGKERK